MTWFCNFFTITKYVQKYLSQFYVFYGTINLSVQKRAFGKDNIMDKIKAAVIGCGNISVMHLDSITALDEAELVAVCDIKADRAAQAADKYHTKTYTDYHEMFAKEKPDAVHLCLPHYLHTMVAEDAFRAGIHVISEKPMSIQYEDAVSAVELADQCGLLYAVIFQCRYNTPSQLVKQRITDGRLDAVKCDIYANNDTP